MCALALYFMHYNFARPHLEKYRLPVFSGISAIQYVLSLVYPLSCLQDAATKPQMTLVLQQMIYRMNWNNDLELSRKLKLGCHG